MAFEDMKRVPAEEELTEESPEVEDSEEAKLSVLEEIRELMDSLDEKKLSEGMSLISKRMAVKPEEDDSEDSPATGSDKGDEQKLRAIAKG